ncbi:hypothetical protein HWX41_02220 [Bacillus paramycoides]|uniref:hypothetical protein n=1 Tax=Bacillus paramycoides TaxID=2026194 RepID=UPI0015BF8517|nr:hypothetical protein [Bacillus paramycoides]NWK67941.1 hypothetical protein [Bacillus paramycoides]
MGDQLPVKARLVKANNQWGDAPPLIKVSLYDNKTKDLSTIFFHLFFFKRRYIIVSRNEKRDAP